VARKSQAGNRIRNAILAGHSPPAHSSSDGPARADRHAHSRALAGSGGNDVTPKDQSLSRRSEDDDRITRDDVRIAFADRRDVPAIINVSGPESIRGRPNRAPLQEIIALSFRDRSFQPLQHLKHVFPDFPFLRRRLIPQQIGGMIGNHQRRSIVQVPSAA
jgi:hypothetical protein